MMNWRDTPRVSRWMLIVLSTMSQCVCGLCKAFTGFPVNMLLHCLNGPLRCDAFGALPFLFVASESEVICSIPTARTFHPTSVANPNTRGCYAGSHDQHTPPT